jgi:hypothetical protein
LRWLWWIAEQQRVLTKNDDEEDRIEDGAEASYDCYLSPRPNKHTTDAAADDAGIGQRFDDDVKPGCSPGALVPLPGRRAVGIVERIVERMREVQQQWGMRDPSLSISDDNSLPPR